MLGARNPLPPPPPAGVCCGRAAFVESSTAHWDNAAPTGRRPRTEIRCPPVAYGDILFQTPGMLCCAAGQDNQRLAVAVEPLADRITSELRVLIGQPIGDCW